MLLAINPLLAEIGTAGITAGAFRSFRHIVHLTAAISRDHRNMSDFRIFDAESKKHEILYVEVPVLPGLEEICSCALAFASDVSECRRVNIRSYRIQKHRIDDGQVVFEVFGPNGRAGCTRPMPEAESNDAQNNLIDLIWHMAFDEEGSYDMGELENPEELDSFDEMVMKCYEADRAEEEAFLAEVNAKERDGESE